MKAFGSLRFFSIKDVRNKRTSDLLNTHRCTKLLNKVVTKTRVRSRRLEAIQELPRQTL